MAAETSTAAHLGPDAEHAADAGPDSGAPPGRTPRAPWRLAVGGPAALLLLGSAGLQWAAASQRWGSCDGETILEDGQVAPGFDFTGSTECFMHEDHLFDYTVPADPWVPIGTAAELYGIGMLVLAVGVLLVAAALLPPRRRALGWIAVVGALVFAASIAGTGLVALLSGVEGRPVAPAGLEPLSGWLWWAGDPAWAAWGIATFLGSRRLAVPILPLGAFTGLAVIPIYTIAPLFVGGSSHDTTPWTEAIPAYAAALAAALLIAVLVLDRRARAAAPVPRAVRPTDEGGAADPSRTFRLRLALCAVAMLLLLGAAVLRATVVGWYLTQTDPSVPARHGLVAAGCTVVATLLIGVATLTSAAFRARRRWRITASISLGCVVLAGLAAGLIAFAGFIAPVAVDGAEPWPGGLWMPARLVEQAAFLALLVAVGAVAPAWLAPFLLLGGGTYVGSSIVMMLGGLIGSVATPGDFLVSEYVQIAVPVVGGALAIAIPFLERRRARANAGDATAGFEPANTGL